MITEAAQQEFLLNITYIFFELLLFICGFRLFSIHLAAFCSWVELWDAGGETCAVLLLLFVLLVYAST